MAEFLLVVVAVFIAYWGGKIVGAIIFLLPRSEREAAAFKACRNCSVRELCETERAERGG